MANSKFTYLILGKENLILAETTCLKKANELAQKHKVKRIHRYFNY